MRPGAEAVEFLAHRLGERYRLANCPFDDLGAEFLLAAEGIEQPGDDRFLELGAVEAFADPRELVEVEIGGVAAAFVDMDAENLPAFQGCGQIDEEDFVEPAFPQQFGRQIADVVRRGDDEHRRGLLRKPGEQRAEHAGCRAPVAAGRVGGPGERFVDFVDPENYRGDALRNLDRPADVFLARTHEAAKHPADVEPQQREPPKPRYSFRAKALAAALDSQQQHSAAPGARTCELVR